MHNPIHACKATLFSQTFYNEQRKVELAQSHANGLFHCRKFRVTAVESNAALLAKAHTQALECGVTINSISAMNVHKKVAQHGGVADLVTVMHGIHLVDYELALEECHRLLRPEGWLCLAWNDR